MRWLEAWPILDANPASGGIMSGPTLRTMALPVYLGALILSSSFLSAAETSRVQGLSVTPESFVLRGRHEGRQLIVSGKDPAGKIRDLTQRAKYAVEPTGVIRVTEQGYVR